MPKGTSKTTIAIQRLLDEREQIQKWLDRLGMAADSTPEQVRSKVKGDYEKRLGEVMRELQTHGNELTNTLERLHGAESGLSEQERDAAEHLAEAELRHAVGEYDESQWRQVHGELLGALVKVREELKQATDEIARLQEVMSLIQPAPARRPAPAPPAPAAKREPPPAKKEPARPAPPAAPEPAGAPGGSQGNAFDELAFLRSVTEDEKQGPAPSRASGAMRAFAEPEPGPPAPAAPAASEGSDAETKKEGTRGSKAAKSLKCKECGAMNLPTEWYCERCGAELAAL